MKIYGIENGLPQIYIDDNISINGALENRPYIKMNEKRSYPNLIADSGGNWVEPNGYSVINPSRVNSRVCYIKHPRDLTLLPNGYTGCVHIDPSVVTNYNDMPEISNNSDPIDSLDYNSTYLIHKIDMEDTSGGTISTIKLESIHTYLILGVIKAYDLDKWRYVPYHKDWVGTFRLFPFRSTELPFGWYFRNGDNYLLDSVQGSVLNSFSDKFKADHNITIKTINNRNYINIPNAFNGDGRGTYERAVDGVHRQVGSIEGDYIRNIQGRLKYGDNKAIIGHMNITDGDKDGAIGVIGVGGDAVYNSADTSRKRDLKWLFFDFDASRVVPTGPENKVLDLGLTPAIYLGVTNYSW